MKLVLKGPISVRQDFKCDLFVFTAKRRLVSKEEYLVLLVLQKHCDRLHVSIAYYDR